MLDLATAARQGGIVAWAYDPASDSMSWSDGFEETLGIARDEARSLSSWSQLVHPEDLEGAFALVTESIRSGLPFRTVQRILTPNGVRWVEAAGGAVGAGPGSMVTGTMVDITGRLEGEAASLAAVANAQAALHLIGAVSWDWDLDTSTVAIEIYGDRAWTHSLPEGTVSESVFFDLIETADHTSLRAFARTIRETGVLCHRLTRAVGRHAVRSHWVTHSDRSGRVVRVVGVTVSDGH